MRPRLPSAPDTVFRIIAVAGSLAFFSGAAVGASALASPRSDANVAANATATTIPTYSAPCAPADAPALPARQYPPWEPGQPRGPICTDQHGNEIPCPPSRNLEECLRAANADYDECIDDADGFWQRLRCGAEHSLDSAACIAEFAKEFLHF